MDDERKYERKRTSSRNDTVIPISTTCAKNVARSLLPRWLRRRGTNCRYGLLILLVICIVWHNSAPEQPQRIVSTSKSSSTSTTTTQTTTSSSSVVMTLNREIYKSYQSEQSENEDRVQNFIHDSFEKASSEFAPFLAEIDDKLQDTRNSEQRLLDGLRDSITPRHITRKPNGQFDIDALAEILNKQANQPRTTSLPKTTAQLTTSTELTDLIKIDRSLLPDDLAVNLASASEHFDETLIREQLEALRTQKDYVEIETPFDTGSIPNIVHYIWFGCHDFKIHHYLSILSAVKKQQPDKIYFHTNCKPGGTYFPTVERHLTVVYRAPPTQVWGQPVVKVEHQSDVARLQVLLQYGGIYIDDDVIILQKLDTLFTNEVVLGEENNDALANTVIMARRDAWFLKRWYWEYRDTFNDDEWSKHSCFVPWSLWHLFPTKVSVQLETMVRPNWEEVTLIYRRVWDWHNNWTIHLYSRFMPLVDKSERTIDELKYLDTTYGQIARFILFGDERMWKLPKPN